VVRKDFNVMGGSFKVMTPFFESLNDGKEFSIIDIVVSFGFDEGFRHKHHRVPETIITFLG